MMPSLKSTNGIQMNFIRCKFIGEFTFIYVDRSPFTDYLNTCSGSNFKSSSGKTTSHTYCKILVHSIEHQTGFERWSMMAGCQFLLAHVYSLLKTGKCSHFSAFSLTQ